ncbi:hypothetical protein BKA70DRAFT_1437422 [Coprinopsis sp. MPI-PUGE-AT-0042]|nr:hypothetical protein BKA70DRAFT_1437422 [Coprinopsis sp. MPI-PUGE-AT-0042]
MSSCISNYLCLPSSPPNEDDRPPVLFDRRDAVDTDTLLNVFHLNDDALGYTDLGVVLQDDTESEYTTTQPQPLPIPITVGRGIMVAGRHVPSTWVGLRPGDVKTLDFAAAVKRGIVPIDQFKTDGGVAPGPGTVYHSHKYQRLHAALKPEDMVYDTTGSLLGHYQALVWESYPSPSPSGPSLFSRVSSAIGSLARRLGRA